MPFFTFQFETLVVFDTSQNKTTIVAANPALYWKGGILPDDEPENFDGRPNDGGGGASWAALVFMAPLLRTFISLLFFSLLMLVCACFFPPGLNLQDVIMIVLSVSVVVVTAIALIFYR